MSDKVISTNRKAHFEYFLLEHYEAGLALYGTEIKSVRAGQVSLAEAFVEIKDMEAWLVNAHIAPYNPASRNNHDPKRARRLLMHKSQIRDMWNEVRQKGVTIIPLKIYIKGGLAKLELATAKGKKLYDKREVIAERDAEREVQRQRSRKDE
jgi:SsrA-binding protein